MRTLIFIALKLLEVAGVALAVLVLWLLGSLIEPITTWYWQIICGFFSVFLVFVSLLCTALVGYASYHIIRANWHWAGRLRNYIKEK